MQFQSNITDHFCEYPISSPLMSYATEWEHKYSSKEKNSFKHYHSLPEIGICIDGCGMFFVGNKAYTFNPGSILYIPAYVPHIMTPVRKRAAGSIFGLDPIYLRVAVRLIFFRMR